MEKRIIKVDLIKLLKFALKRLWLVVICAELGFGIMYLYSTRMIPDTYTSSGTMYVNNGNPNVEAYQYTNSNDIDSAVRLIDTYMVVVNSEKVMGSVIERLSKEYPGITASQVSSSLSMSSVSDTGVVLVRSKTNNPTLSKDIVNVVLEVAPAEIIRVVGAGKIEIIDYAVASLYPDSKNELRNGIQGIMIGAALAICILALLYLLNQKIMDTKDLTECYTPPVLSGIQRIKKDNSNASSFILCDQSPMEVIENYAKLRMNLMFSLAAKESKTVVVTSAISGEGKSTIASNLAISCAMGGKRVLLIDGDMRRASQTDVFQLDKSQNVMGLSDVLAGRGDCNEVIIKNIREMMDLLPAGNFPPNPAELLGSNKANILINELEKEYDLILLDMPPINIVSDPLILSSIVAGCIFIVRQDYSDHRDIRRALTAAEMTGMDVLGFVFYGEELSQEGYYNRRYYKNYYDKYDYRNKHVTDSTANNPTKTSTTGNT